MQGGVLSRTIAAPRFVISKSRRSPARLERDASEPLRYEHVSSVLDASPSCRRASEPPSLSSSVSTSAPSTHEFHLVGPALFYTESSSPPNSPSRVSYGRVNLAWPELVEQGALSCERLSDDAMRLIGRLVVRKPSPEIYHERATLRVNLGVGYDLADASDRCFLAVALGSLSRGRALVCGLLARPALDEASLSLSLLGIDPLGERTPLTYGDVDALIGETRPYFEGVLIGEARWSVSFEGVVRVKRA